MKALETAIEKATVKAREGHQKLIEKRDELQRALNELDKMAQDYCHQHGVPTSELNGELTINLPWQQPSATTKKKDTKKGQNNQKIKRFADLRPHVLEALEQIKDSGKKTFTTGDVRKIIHKNTNLKAGKTKDYPGEYVNHILNAMKGIQRTPQQKKAGPKFPVLYRFNRAQLSLKK